jgi:predicted nucleic acid-binding protein
MGAVVLGSSVVIALFDPADAHHAASAAVVRAVRDAEDDMILPVSVLSEDMVAVYRHDPGTVPRRLAALDAAFGSPRAVDREVALRAAELRGRHRCLRLPDALVLAVGQVDGVDRVLTADRRWAAVDERVEVVGG